MITNIEVSGFKSLNDFHLRLRPGLNVLVGPNGSGKSNVLSLFEFLSHLARYPLAEAVSRAGGAGNIFARTVGQTIGNAVSIRVSGYGKYAPYQQSRRLDRAALQYYIEYEYQATIKLSEKGTSLRYTEQRLSFSLFRNSDARTIMDRKNSTRRWHVDIVLGSDEQERPTILRNKINYGAIKKVSLRTIHKQDYFDLVYSLDILSHPLFSQLRRVYPYVSKIYQDVAAGYVYNFNPREIKEPEDIARPPIISADGGGLAATLFSMQEEERPGPYKISFFEVQEYATPTKPTTKHLKELFCLINDNIMDVRVENDALENKLVVIAKISSGDGYIEVPLAMLSDGTVKWLSLVTAVAGRRGIFALEEPENFLHPNMQKEVVAMLRDNATASPENFSLLTTHSETLLNSLDPEEIVVVTMQDGKTVAFRSDHADELRDEINRSGFGLGHFYVAGAVD